ncbi:hypothetical protein PDL71_08710 [Lacibacter sp. MH-610]
MIKIKPKGSKADEKALYNAMLLGKKSNTLSTKEQTAFLKKISK